jgi:hypothetical protein
MRIPVALRGGNCEAGKVSNRHDPGQVIRTVYVSKKVRVSVMVKGKWVTKTKHVRVPKKVTEQVTESVPGPPAPCYANGALASSAPSDYANYVFALQVLTHESIHPYDFRSGGTIDQPFEIRAECQGMQWLTRVATSLGTTADDAQAIANYYYYTVIYPTRKALANGPYPYLSADCHQDGPRDLSPGDGGLAITEATPGNAVRKKTPG